MKVRKGLNPGSYQTVWEGKVGKREEGKNEQREKVKGSSLESTTQTSKARKESQEKRERMETKVQKQRRGF